MQNTTMWCRIFKFTKDCILFALLIANLIVNVSSSSEGKLSNYKDVSLIYDFQTQFVKQKWQKIYANRICKMIRHAGCLNKKKQRTTTRAMDSTETDKTPGKMKQLIVFSEPSDLVKDRSCMKFPFSKNSLSTKENRLGKVTVILKVKRKIRKPRKKRRRFNIKLYAIDKNKRKQFLCKANVSVQHDDIRKKTIRIEIPSNAVANFVVDNAFNMCISCKQCRRNVKIIFPTGKRRNAAEMRSLEKNPGLRRDRPFIALEMKELNGEG